MFSHYVNVTGKFLLPMLLFSFGAGFLTSCVTIKDAKDSVVSYFSPEVPKVFIAHYDLSYRFLFIIDELKLRGAQLPPSALPYSESGNGAAWIGEDFPFEKMMETLRYSRKYYKGVRYIALSDIAHSFMGRHASTRIYLGADTGKALSLGLKPFDDKEMQQLLQSKTKDDFVRMVRSKYPDDRKQTK